MVDKLGDYGDARDVDLLINVSRQKGDAWNPDILFWRAGTALEKIAKRLESSGGPRDVADLIKLTRVASNLASTSALPPRSVDLSCGRAITSALPSLTGIDLSVEAAVHSLVTLVTKYTAEISTDDLAAIARLEDRLYQMRLRPVRVFDYEGNEIYWVEVSCVALKGVAQRELERRRTASLHEHQQQIDLLFSRLSEAERESIRALAKAGERKQAIIEARSGLGISLADAALIVEELSR